MADTRVMAIRKMYHLAAGSIHRRTTHSKAVIKALEDSCMPPNVLVKLVAAPLSSTGERLIAEDAEAWNRVSQHADGNAVTLVVPEGHCATHGRFLIRGGRQ